MDMDALLKQYDKLSAEEKLHFQHLIVQEEVRDFSPEWRKEIDRRLQDIEKGAAALVNGPELSERIRKKTGDDVNLP